jgi:transcriptional regulator
MYNPAHFEETRIDVIHDVMRNHPLATIIYMNDINTNTGTSTGLVGNHIPLMIDTKRDVNHVNGTLMGHVARANPIWKNTNPDVLVIFQGAQAYITPSWYASKKEHGKVVPTWNYVVVHAHGKLRAIDDIQWLMQHLNIATDTHEASETHPWKVSDAPADFMASTVKAIVGIEINITRLECKWKVSQNRSNADRVGVADGLAIKGDHAMSALVNIGARHPAIE